MARACRNLVCLEAIPDLAETIGVIEDCRERSAPVPPSVELHAFGFCSEACEHAHGTREQIASLKREIRARGRKT